MELILIRHGESDANRQGILQGHFDSPLNSRGRDQAIALAEALAPLEVGRLYASDLKRARETGEILSRRLGLPLILDHSLREVDVGIFSGLTWETIAERYPEEYERFRSSGDWEVVPGSERNASSLERLKDFLDRLREAKSGDRVAIVSHGAILRRMIHLLLDIPFPSGIYFELHNASYTEIHLTTKGATVRCLNRVTYGVTEPVDRRI